MSNWKIFRPFISNLPLSLVRFFLSLFLINVFNLLLKYNEKVTEISALQFYLHDCYPKLLVQNFAVHSFYNILVVKINTWISTSLTGFLISIYLHSYLFENFFWSSIDFILEKALSECVLYWIVLIFVSFFPHHVHFFMSVFP